MGVRTGTPPGELEGRDPRKAGAASHPCLGNPEFWHKGTGSGPPVFRPARAVLRTAHVTTLTRPGSRRLGAPASGRHRAGARNPRW